MHRTVICDCWLWVCVNFNLREYLAVGKVGLCWRRSGVWKYSFADTKRQSPLFIPIWYKHICCIDFSINSFYKINKQMAFFLSFFYWLLFNILHFQHVYLFKIHAFIVHQSTWAMSLTMKNWFVLCGIFVFHFCKFS